ncbi:hypothetical protein M073_1357 [Bacteroides fragilis str. DS-71]|nr:hypothetical protein M073_1357 [Bacteroides fragilis str. DS-71]
MIVEVLNENGLPIFGFTKKDCIKLKKIDATKEGVRKGYPLFLCKSPNFPKLGLFNLL